MKRRPFIALVDDDRQVLKFLQQELEEGGYEVAGTTSGRTVLSVIAERVPDLLIVDLNMPELDGFDLLKILRATHPYLRTIAISGFLRGRPLEAARYIGAFATLEKPVAAGGIVAKVREILGEKALDHNPPQTGSLPSAQTGCAAGARAPAKEKSPGNGARRPSNRAAHKHR